MRFPDELEREKEWQRLLTEFHNSDEVCDDHAIDFIIWVQDKYEAPVKIMTIWQ